MPMITAKCPSCGETIQIPGDKKETFCAYCGCKFETKAAIVVLTPDKKPHDNDDQQELAKLKKRRDRELKDFLKGPGFTSLYQKWEFPNSYNMLIEQLDPNDVLSKEMRIFEELRSMLIESCGETGVFSPNGIKFFGNKITVSLEHEPGVLQHITNINKEAELIQEFNLNYDFLPTQQLIMDIIKLDKTDNLYTLFWNGLEVALVSLQNYFIPVVKKNVQVPLNDKLADCLSFIVQLITDKMDKDQLLAAQKCKIKDFKHLTLLK